MSPAAPSCPNEPGWNSHLPKIQEYAKLLYLLQIFPVKAFPCVRAAHCMALPSLLLAAFVFVAGFEWGNLSLQLPRTGTWVHMDGPRGVSGSSLCPTEEGLGDGFYSYFTGSVVTDHHQLKSPFRNVLAGRNKDEIRNCLHRSCITGFELPDTCTCSLVGTWLFPGSGQVLGLERTC